MFGVKERCPNCFKYSMENNRCSSCGAVRVEGRN